MDMIIHFWDNEKNKVCSRYFDSNFLGHTSAQDLLKSLQSLLTTLNPMGLIPAFCGWTKFQLETS